MELAQIIRQLWERRAWVVLGLAVSAVLSVALSYRVTLSPLGLHPKTTSYGAATTQVFVDSRRSSLATLAGDSQTLSSRSTLFAQFLASAEVRADINSRMGLPPNAIPVISNPSTVSQLQSQNVSSGAQTAGGSGGSGYSISFQPQIELPIIDIYTRGPDAQSAEKLADVAAGSLSAQVSRLSDASGIPTDSPNRIVMREIGPATGGQVTSQISAIRLAITFAGVLIAWCALIVFATWIRREWIRTAPAPERSIRESAPVER